VGKCLARARARARFGELGGLGVSELRLFEPIDARYTEAQDQAVGQPVRRPKKMDVFKWVVRFYPLLLLLLVLGVAIIAWSSQ
jgi:hypothetical protein